MWYSFILLRLAGSVQSVKTSAYYEKRAFCELEELPFMLTCVCDVGDVIK